MSRLIRINPRDNVAVALQPLKAGEEALGVTLREDIPAGHKFALCDIAENENVVKYCFPIGHATQPIPAGSWVHTHNVKTNLSGLLEYSYHPRGYLQRLRSAGHQEQPAHPRLLRAAGRARGALAA